MGDGPTYVPLDVVSADAYADTREGLRATIDLAPIGLAQFDVDGRFLHVNDRLCSILGCDRAEIESRSFHEVTFPDDLPHCLELSARLAANQIPDYCLEKRFVRPDGSMVWVRITVSAVRRRDGGVAFFIGAAEDITAAEALKTAEERLRTALAASGIGTFRFDVRRKALDWADGLSRVFGTGDNVTLDEFFSVMHPDDRPHVVAAYARSTAEGVDFEEEFRVIWPDGSVHWLHDRGQTVPGADGKPLYILGAITDISNHKRMEEVLAERDAQLRDREVRYRKALDVENIGVIFFDNDHGITGFNDAFGRMSGYASVDVAAARTSWHDLAYEPREAAAADAGEFAATGRIAPRELEFTRPDGSRWWGLVTATRVGDSEGVRFVVDITARKLAEREREAMLRREQRARNEAERATGIREQVLGFVAHDLRNPLQAVVLAASALLEMPLSEEQRSRRAAVIKRCARDMDRLIADLLDASRIEAGTFAVRLERVSVPALVSEVFERFQEQARAADVRLVAEIEPHVGTIDGDGQRLAQAMANLLNNSLKFTPPGGCVSVSAQTGPRAIELAVRDTGCGIAPENLSMIFDRFWQANRLTGGAGLGLAIVKGIIESHAGEISVESVPGAGTTFRVRLPCREAGSPERA